MTMNPQSLVEHSPYEQTVSSSDTEPQCSDLEPPCTVSFVCNPFTLKPEQNNSTPSTNHLIKHTPTQSMLASSLMVHVPQDATVPSVVQHYHVPGPPIVGGVTSVSSPVNSFAQPSPLISDAEASDCPISQRQVPVNLKKHKLLKKCHRHLKRLLRNPGSSRAPFNGPLIYTSQADDSSPDDHQQCRLNRILLEDMQAKYSALSDEVASLRRQLVAVQHAFTSLRTMLLASFSTSSPDGVEVPSLTHIANLFATEHLPVPWSSSDSDHRVGVATFCSTSGPPPVRVLQTPMTTETQLSGIGNQPFGPTTVNATTADYTKITASTTWYPPPIFSNSSCPGISEAVKSSTLSTWPTLSSATNNAEPVCLSLPLSADKSSLVNNVDKDVTDEEIENIAPQSLSKPTQAVNSSLSNTQTYPLIISVSSVTEPTGINASPTDTCSPIVSLDTATIADKVRRRLLLLNLSRRGLSLELKGTSHKTISHLLRKPKPWSQLSARAREIYLRLDDWLKREANGNHTRGSHVTTLDCTSPFTPFPQSIQSDCPSPWTVSGTDETPVSQDLLDDLDNAGEPVPPSPLEASVSPNSFSSIPTMDSASEHDRYVSSDTHRTSSSILASVLTNLTAVSTNTPSIHDPNRKKKRTPLEVETQRRISDILSAARKAMAEEKKSCATDGDGTKRKKRPASSDSNSHLVQTTSAGEPYPCSLAAQLSTVLSEASLPIANPTSGTEVIQDPPVPSTHGMVFTSQSTNLSTVPNLPTVMSTSVAQPMQHEFSSSGLPAQDQFASLPNSTALGLRSNLVSGQLSFSELVQLLAAQAANSTQTSTVSGPSENTFAPTTTLQLGRRLPQPINSLKVSCDPIVVPNGTDPSLPCQLPPLIPAPSLPLLLVPPASVPEPVMVSPPMPTLIQLGGLPTHAGPQSPAPNLLTPLQQTLLLLAAATNAGVQTTAVDNTDKVPGHLPVTSANLGEPAHAPLWINGNQHVQNADGAIAALSALGTSVPSLINTGSSVSSQLNQEIISSLSSLNFQGLTTAEVDRLAVCLPELDTWDLCTRTKNFLRHHSVSQRLFAEAVFGMSEAWVNDLLNRTERWASLTPRSRIAYTRLYLWLHQPNPMAPILETLINRQALLRSLPTSTSQNASFIDLTSERVTPDGSSVRANTVLDIEGPNSRKRPAPTHSLTGSRTTPLKIAKSEAQSATNPLEDGNRSSEQLDEYERQSLFDIAKAAAVAMQRGASSGIMKFARGRGQSAESPVKSANSSRSNTPLKPDVSRTFASEFENPVKPLVLSPNKLSPGRNRIVFTPEQKEALVATFNRQPYPPVDKLRELARDLDLNYKTVLHWFHNRRMRSPKPLLHNADSNVSTCSSSTLNRCTTVGVKSQSVDNQQSSASDSCGSTSEPNQRQANYTNGTCSSAVHLAHSNRRKRPDPARFITPRLS